MNPLRLLAAALLLLTPPLYAQTGLTRLGEFKVNSTTSGDQTEPAIAAAADGRFVVVWRSSPVSGGPNDIFAQRFDAGCSPIGGIIPVNQVTSGNQRSPSVAMNDQGEFVIVWVGDGQDGGLDAIYGRKFSLLTGEVAGQNEFKINSNPPPDTTGAFLTAPSIAMRPDGRFVVTWVGSGYSCFKVFMRTGSADGGEVRFGNGYGNQPDSVNLSGVAFVPAVNGGFATAWSDQRNDCYIRFFDEHGNTRSTHLVAPPAGGDADVHPVISFNSNGKGIVIRRQSNPPFAYDLRGTIIDAAGDGTVGASFSEPVNTALDGDQTPSSVAQLPDGGFVVAYSSETVDGNGYGVCFQRYDSLGAKVGGETIAPLTTAGDQVTAPFNRCIAADGDGNFIVTWWSAGAAGDGFDIYAEKFYQPNQGPPLSEFRVNTTTKGDQTLPAVATMPDGRFVAVWRGFNGAGSNAIFGQRFDTEGRRFGTEFTVNASLPASESYGDPRSPSLAPSVGFDSTGAFTVVWVGASDGDGPGIAGRRFPWDPQTAAGSEFSVNSQSAGNQSQPSIGVAPDGRFAVAWLRYDVSGAAVQRCYVQFFSSNGTPVGGEVEFGTHSYEPAVGVSPLGRFVIARRHNFLTSWLFVNQFDLNGAPIGSGAVPVDDSLSPEKHTPGLAVRADGSMIVTWDALAGDSTGTAVHGQKLDASGNRVGGVFTVNTFTGGDQLDSSVAIGPGNDFIVCYRSTGLDGSGQTVAVQRFAGGTTTPQKSGSEIVVNQFRNGEQSPSGRQRSIATDAVGNYVVVWQSQNQDGDGFGIYATKVLEGVVPTISTQTATEVSSRGATLNASVVPNGVPTSVAFEYDTQAGFLSANVAQAGSFNELSAQPAQITVTGLTKDQTYYFRAKATYGTVTILGSTQTFNTANVAPVANADTFFVTGQDQTLDLLANDTDADLPDDALTLSGAVPQPSFTAADSSTVIAGTLQKITLGSREAFSFTAKNTFTANASFTYTVEDAGALTSTATVQLYRFTALRGIYSGLVQDTTGATADGVLKLTVNAAAGRFTGVLFWDGGSYPVDSIFAADGSVTLGVAGTALQFTLRVVDPIAGIIAGTLTDNTVPSQPVTATITLVRESDGGDDDEANPKAGNYTTFIDEPQIVDPSGGVAAAAEPRVDTSFLPTGTGFSFAKIGPKKQKRRGRFATSLADGSKFTAGSGLAGRSYTLAQTLYKIRNGQFGGSFNSQPTFPPGNNSRFESSASWTRSTIPDIPGSEFFPGGFRLKLALAGVSYDGKLVHPINFDQGSGKNAQITFKGGGLSGDLQFLMNVDSRNRVTVDPADRLTVKMNKTAGTFSGSFTHPGETKPVKFIGIFQQSSPAAPVAEKGLGYFRALGLKRTGRVEMKRH